MAVLIKSFTETTTAIKFTAHNLGKKQNVLQKP